MSSPRPWPLGVTLVEGGVNVAVHSAHAERIDFCVFDDNEERRFPLPHRDGHVWFGFVPDVVAGSRYGLRAHGPFRPAEGQRFNPRKVLIDPYARALERPIAWSSLMSGYPEGWGDDLAVGGSDSAAAVPKAIVVDSAFDWGDDAPPGTAWERTVIYEAHVKGLTAQHPDVPAELRGTYLALASDPVIEHLTSLGVTAVELLPVPAFIDDRHLVERELTNYWGYQPIAFCAPEPRYAIDDAVLELKQMVRRLHQAGLEVLLDVVYNHTGEGDELGPTLSLRGLDNVTYYRLLDGGRHYVNDTGTGNTLDVAEPATLQLVLDTLRHWVEEMHVDGFRFDLATTVGREPHGFDPHGGFFDAIRQDPVLSRVKLIAEPWDLGPGGYQLGHFPHPFAEWNDRFRDGLRRAWRADPVPMAEVASRVVGSAGQFEHSGRPATSSVNLLTAHDGFTLHDVVSYTGKHNEANGEDNRDGHGENYSDNLGVEGPTDDPVVIEARLRRKRAMLATLLVSQGTPMILGGDELGNSQQGNNNAYAQDNEIGWVDWGAADPDLLAFVRRLVAVRREHPVLAQRGFLHGRIRDRDGLRDLEWFHHGGASPSDGDWHDPAWRTLCFAVRGAAQDPVGETLDETVFVIVNLGADQSVVLPDGDWTLLVDSARPTADGETIVATYQALAQSVIALSHAPSRIL